MKHECDRCHRSVKAVGKLWLPGPRGSHKHQSRERNQGKFCRGCKEIVEDGKKRDSQERYTRRMKIKIKYAARCV